MAKKPARFVPRHRLTLNDTMRVLILLTSAVCSCLGLIPTIEDVKLAKITISKLINERVTGPPDGKADFYFIGGERVSFTTTTHFLIRILCFNFKLRCIILTFYFKFLWILLYLWN